VDWWIGPAWGLGGFFFASFVEYWGHRLMHGGKFLGAVHRNHHATGEAQGVWLEFYDYMKYSIFLMIPAFFVSLAAGIGFAVGATLFAFFSAFAHQLQHDNPGKCFWMSMPLHFVHHKYKMWHYNFGMAVDWWDRVFRTYRPKEDWREGLDPAQNSRSIWDVQWLKKRPPADAPG